RLQCLQDVANSRVVSKVCGSGKSARQHDHVEVPGSHIIESAVRQVLRFARGFDGTGLGSRRGDFHAGTTQNVDHGDSLNFLEAGSQGNKDTFHTAKIVGCTTKTRWNQRLEVLFHFSHANQLSALPTGGSIHFPQKIALAPALLSGSRKHERNSS